MFEKNNVKRLLRKLGVAKSFVPKPGNVRFGDLYRTVPLSRKFGYDRGGPIDRYYIENFLEANASHIKGRVLEVADNTYTKKFGGFGVTQSDILYVNDSNPKATVVADLGKPLTLPQNQFDCIILTQTLQFIYDYEKAIENCFNLLKPGGYLLLTVPGISHFGKDPWNWYWSFTTFSIRAIFLKFFREEDTIIASHGNVLVSSGFLYGMGKKEIQEKDFAINDPLYQLIVTAAAKKPGPNV
jgi:hypothetical protein